MSHENTKHEKASADILIAEQGVSRQGVSPEERRNILECEKGQFMKRNPSNPTCMCVNNRALKPGKQTFTELGGEMGKPTVIAGGCNNYSVSPQ